MNVSMGALGSTGMARSSIQDAELQSRQREADAARRTLNGGQSIDNKDKKLRESCEGFEAMFIQKMWESMRATLPKDGIMSGGRDEKTWQGMYDQELGKSMAKAGGIGLADMMVTQLSRNLQDASEVAAQRRSPMAIAPVPLMPEVAPQNTSLTPPQAKLNPLGSPNVGNLYSGDAVQPQAPDVPSTADATGTASALATGSENSATATTVPAEPMAPAVQSVLKEFAAQTGTIFASSPGVVNNTATPVAAGLVSGVPVNTMPGTGLAAAPTAPSAMAATAATAQTPVAAEAPQITRITHTSNRTQRVARPPKGMPRMTPRNPNLRTEIPTQPPATPPAQGAVPTQQANSTIGAHFASTSSGTTITRTAGGMTSGTAQTPPGTATNLMKEQMS